MRKLFAVLVILTSLFAPAVAMPAMAHAVNVFPLCSGSSEGTGGDNVSAKSTAVCGAEASGSSTLLVTTLKTVFNILSFIIGVAAIIMLVIGGFKLIASQGDAANVKSGRDTVIYSLVGLAAAALAQVIVVFVLNKLK
jgi:hypothetical protein